MQGAALPHLVIQSEMWGCYFSKSCMFANSSALIFKKGDSVSFNSNHGVWLISDGVFIKQKPLPNGTYANVGVYVSGNFYMPDDNVSRLYPLIDGEMVRVDSPDPQQFIKQLHQAQELIYILNCRPLKLRIYLFLEWCKALGINRLLTHEQIGSFCSCERPAVVRNLKNIQEMGLIECLSPD